jgi:O-acetylhomoserine/O-acetylserine sulfhydrylase-like pyridoxal-dependent enzyme
MIDMYYTDIDADGLLTVFKVASDGQVWCFIDDPANTDYQQYLAWLEEGNVAEEWNPEGAE